MLTEFTSHDGDMLSLVLDNELSDEEVLLLDCDSAYCLRAQRSCCSSACFCLVAAVALFFLEYGIIKLWDKEKIIINEI